MAKKQRAEDPAGRDRRSHPRLPVTEVSGSFLFSTEGKILNLSLDGMALQTSDYLQVGRVYSLKLSHEEEELVLKGRIVWCRMVGTAGGGGEDTPPLYTAGIQFEELLSDTAREVHRFLGANAVVSLEKRLFGRFRLHTPETANLDFEASFRVDKISLSGMEVQADTFVEPGVEIDVELRVGRKRCPISGRVVHSQRLQPQPGVAGASLLGIAFLEMDEASELAIRDLVRAAIT